MSTTSGTTSTTRTGGEEELAKSALLEVLQNISCHLPRSVLLECIQQVRKRNSNAEDEQRQDGLDLSHSLQGLRKRSSLDAQDILSLNPTSQCLSPMGSGSRKSGTDNQSRSSLLTLLSASSRNFFAMQKSAQDLFGASYDSTGTGASTGASTGANTSQDKDVCRTGLAHQMLCSGRGTGATFSICTTTGTSAATITDQSSVYTSFSNTDSTFLSHASPHAQLVRTLNSDSTFIEQLSLEFDFMDTSLAEQEEQENTNTEAGAAASVVSKDVSPKPNMHRRFTGLRRASLTPAAQGLIAGSSQQLKQDRQPSPALRRTVSFNSQDSERPRRSLRRSTKQHAQHQQQDDDTASVSKLRQGRLSCRSNANGDAAADQRSVAGSIFSRRSINSHQSSLATNDTGNSTVHPSRQTPHQPTMPVRLATSRYSGALVFCDISGFSRLSTMLPVEAFSNIVHDYFRKIVQQIELHGGDILKFAGDAIIAEWKVTIGSDDDNTTTRTPRQAVYAAALCASNLVDCMSDVSVKMPEKLTDPQEHVIAVGFGDIVQCHPGDGDRVELLVLGDALRQITEAVNKARLGQVVVSPEVARLLRDVVDIRRPPVGSGGAVTDDENGRVTVIAYKKERFIRVKPEACKLATSSIQPFHGSSKEAVQGCKDFSVANLQELYLRTAPYLHPVALFHEVSNTEASAMAVAESQRRSSFLFHQQQSHLSLAELRDVCTIFIQPELPQEWLTGKDAGNEEALKKLNLIMLIASSEADRFSAHLRQFIVDDKGLVIIVNFGLRGSTFPNQVAERVMPFMDHVKVLLRSELEIECRIGTTHGRAYCGLVAPGDRTEYTVLGPSVNLAARLMTHVRNPGIMVDEAIRIKAGDRPFRSLCPIRAKGYSTYIRIFIPETTERTGWKDSGSCFVGRHENTQSILEMAKAVMDSTNRWNPHYGLGGGQSRIVFLEGGYGLGKTALLSQATIGIEALLNAQQAKHMVWRQLCCDEDSFKPFSIVRPLFLDILRRKKEQETHFHSVKLVGHSVSHEACEIDEARMYVTLLHVCLDARVPLHYVEAMAGLIFSTKLSDIGTWSDAATRMDEWNRLAKYICQVLILCTRQERLVFLALDNVSGLDEMSWKLLQGLFYCASNVLILGAARTEHDLNINPTCWRDLNCLHEKEEGEARFRRIKLEPLIESEVSELVTNRMDAANDAGTSKDIVAHTVFLESKGNPLLANEILDILYPSTAANSPNKIDTRAYTTASNVDELVLNRLDSLAPAVRFVVDLGALLGSPFSLLDIVAVLERYHNMPTTDTTTYGMAKLNLQVAVENGLLTTSFDEYQGISYTFSHTMWQETISRQNLDSWKEQMRQLIDEVLPENDPTKTELEAGGGLPKLISFGNLAELDDEECGKKDAALEDQDDHLDGSANEQNVKRLRAMAKMFRRKYKSSGRKGASETVRKLKGLLGGSRKKRAKSSKLGARLSD
ncbi:cyclase type 10 [Seminavis robusta]|uniref:Cyclase type 10 n=1 Tax=Seminavis robusta TaxID=568900 RepID=A0A9N8EEL0_9STRA|nr:cyclase type 10 [Seminavis robusta]|eukprot:Sro1038_g234330.1 cyclase type 10 (1464) ;mRNA; f:30741-35620